MKNYEMKKRHIFTSLDLLMLRDLLDNPKANFRLGRIPFNLTRFSNILLAIWDCSPHDNKPLHHFGLINSLCCIALCE